MNPHTLADAAAKVTTWYASLPEPKPPVLTCPELHKGVRLPMNILCPALLLLGWKRAEVWGRRNNRRVKRVLYAPPGHRIPRPPRGRPRFSLSDCLTVTIL